MSVRLRQFVFRRRFFRHCLPLRNVRELGKCRIGLSLSDADASRGHKSALIGRIGRKCPPRSESAWGFSWVLRYFLTFYQRSPARGKCRASIEKAARLLLSLLSRPNTSRSRVEQTAQLNGGLTHDRRCSPAVLVSRYCQSTVGDLGKRDETSRTAH